VEPSHPSAYNRIMLRAGKFPAALALMLLVFTGIAQVAAAQTGLPLPRFASLRADKVHMRTGPGVRYPVEWVYVFRGMPVEIVGEFENWRRVRDWQGSEGWVHRTMLSGRRTALVTGGLQPLRADPSPDAQIVARVEEKVLARILKCENDWCRVETEGKRGWMRRSHVWGVYSTERIE
jgi:SH3-like domain-containing protein